ncbi:hypothetical protein SNEBB_007673 [Seison nebaliae]|nr:hypothetical protein SNEBB_007673 [Seison nebaliae]
MAERLASIYGTEKDKVNCSFYFKIGACRHGDRCARMHNKPTSSQVILIKNMYLSEHRKSIRQRLQREQQQLEAVSQNGQNGPANQPSSTQKRIVETMTSEEWKTEQHYFEGVLQDLWMGLHLNYGEIDEIQVCDNLSEHLSGNVYVKFKYEEQASECVEDLNVNRWFNGRPMFAELSPVSNFKEASCRQYSEGNCPRGGFCNFMHLKFIPPFFKCFMLFKLPCPPVPPDTVLQRIEEQKKVLLSLGFDLARMDDARILETEAMMMIKPNNRPTNEPDKDDTKLNMAREKAEKLYEKLAKKELEDGNDGELNNNNNNNNNDIQISSTSDTNMTTNGGEDHMKNDDENENNSVLPTPNAGMSNVVEGLPIYNNGWLGKEKMTGGLIKPFNENTRNDSTKKSKFNNNHNGSFNQHNNTMRTNMNGMNRNHDGRVDRPYHHNNYNRNLTNKDLNRNHNNNFNPNNFSMNNNKSVIRRSNPNRRGDNGKYSNTPRRSANENNYQNNSSHSRMTQQRDRSPPPSSSSFSSGRDRSPFEKHSRRYTRHYEHDMKDGMKRNPSSRNQYH